MRLKLFLSGFLCLMISSPVFAEPSLDSLLTGIYGAGNYTQLSVGTITPGGSPLTSVGVTAFENLGANATAKARYASLNSDFGFVDGSGFHAVITGITPGTVQPNGTNISSQNLINGGTIDAYLYNPLVFAIETGSVTWSQESASNSDGSVHVAIFAIGNPATTRQFALAFEDLPNGGSDWDYNDLIVDVTGVTPAAVPEPASLILLTIGGLGIAGYTARKRRALLS